MFSFHLWEAVGAVYGMFGKKVIPCSILSNKCLHSLYYYNGTTMEYDTGFDMVPCLSKGAVDRMNWQSFIELIKKHYQNDDLVEVKPNYLEFKAGEHPLLPFEGHKFLRFSSKIPGDPTKGVKEYIDTVTRIAQLSFGSRIRCWNEAADERGFYNRQEVYTSIESYEQVCYVILNMILSVPKSEYSPMSLKFQRP